MDTKKYKFKEVMNTKSFKFQNSFRNDLRNAPQGNISDQFKSYVADGKSAIEIEDRKKKVDRAAVMKAVRENLLKQMSDVNNESLKSAEQMKDEHFRVHQEMESALNVVRASARKKKNLEFKLKMQRGRISTDGLLQSKNALADMLNADIDKYSTEYNRYKRKGEYNNKVIYKKSKEQNINDQQLNNNGQQENQVHTNYNLVDALHDRFEDIKENKAVFKEINSLANPIQTKGIKNLFRSWSINKQIAATEKEIKQKETEIENNKEQLKKKASEWNRRRKEQHEGVTFRGYYNQFDQAAARYYMLSRNVRNRVMPQKNVKEYVGEFSLTNLDETLNSLKDNPYLDTGIKIKNKKRDDLSNDFNALIKNHTKIVMLSEADEDGNQIRYKMVQRPNMHDFDEAYEAKRQFDKNTPTALVNTNRVKQVKKYRAIKDKLYINGKVFNKDEFIDSEDNIEIIEAKKDGRKLKGVYLYGEFISTNGEIIKGKSDSKAIGEFTSWSDIDQKEDVRRAVLQASIFNEINSRSIQEIAGFDAAETVGKGPMEHMISDLVKITDLNDADLAEYGVVKQGITIDTIKADIKEKYKKDHNDKEPSAKELDKLLKEYIIKEAFFGSAHKKLIEDNAKRAGAAVLDKFEAQWEKDLTGEDEEKKNKIPDGVKVKVAFDVISQEYEKDQGIVKKLKDPKSRIGKLIESIKKDNVLVDLSLMLLKEDSKPVFWDMAKEICVYYIGWSDVFDTEYKIAYEKGKVKNGQLMRVLLIDELNKNRTNNPFVGFTKEGISNKLEVGTNGLLTIISNPLSLVTWDRLKLWREDIAADKRLNISNFFKKAVADGVLFEVAGDIFTDVIDVLDDNKIYDVSIEQDRDYLSVLRMANAYVTDAGAYMSTGLVAAGANAFNNVVYHGGRETIAGKTVHTDDAENQKVLLGSKLIKDGTSAIKQITKIIKNLGKKKDELDPKTYSWLENFYLKSAVSILKSGCSIFGSIMGYKSFMSGDKGQKKQKGVANAFKNLMTAAQGVMGWRSNHVKVSEFCKVEEGLTTALNDYKTGKDNKEGKILAENSQLLFGLNVAKRKARDDRAFSITDVLVGLPKAIAGFLKTFVPNPVTKTAASVVDAITNIPKHGVGFVRAKLARKDMIQKMIGNKYGGFFGGAHKSVVNSVLQRETGIKDVDYLYDLAKIFNAVNTQVFLRNAKTPDEIALAKKMAKTMFNNKLFESDQGAQYIKKIKTQSLLNAYGVGNDYHLILKHSLQKDKDEWNEELQTIEAQKKKNKKDWKKEAADKKAAKKAKEAAEKAAKKKNNKKIPSNPTKIIQPLTQP
ncbi:MAG: hypothetical protein K6G03_12370 [Lachnospiraceae bacterium]|nr:hypothetical protein [Lachnospiraceae bacterium]